MALRKLVIANILSAHTVCLNFSEEFGNFSLAEDTARCVEGEGHVDLGGVWVMVSVGEFSDGAGVD